MIPHLDQQQNENLTELLQALLSLRNTEECRAFLRDLCTVLARQEWGFEGLIMSDWNTTVPADGSTPWKCAWAGNDVIMPGNPDDDADIRAAFARGDLSEEQIRACAGRLIALTKRLRG